MKTLIKSILLAAGLAAALPFVDAANLDPATPTPAPVAGRHPRARAVMQRRAVRQRIANRLGLSPDQRTQLKAERTKTAAAVKALRADPNLTPDQKHAKVRETLQAARSEMRGVLTPDQQQTLDQMKKRVRHLRRRG